MANVCADNHPSCRAQEQKQVHRSRYATAYQSHEDLLEGLVRVGAEVLDVPGGFRLQ